MIATFLGTGTSQGVPVIACSCRICTSEDVRDKRLRSSVMISSGKHNIVIDTGPDFRQQMLKNEVRSLDAVVFTHEHKDHIAGLDDVRAFNYFSGKAMPVYCTEAVEIAIRREFHYAFSGEKYPGVPEIEFKRIGEEAFTIQDVTFIPIKVKHMHMDVLGFRINDFTYITDANLINDEELMKVNKSNTLVLNALRKEKHPSHFNLEEALHIINGVQPKTAFLTHISHQLGKHAEVNALLPPSVSLAYDGLQIEI